MNATVEKKNLDKLSHRDAATETSEQPFARSFQAGPRYAYMGNVLSFLLRRTDIHNSGLAIVEFRAPHGCEPPPHVHENEHELYYIHTGDATFYIEQEREPISAGPGRLVLLPQGRAHTFITESESLSGLLLTLAVGAKREGLADYFNLMLTGPTDLEEIQDSDLRYQGLDSVDLHRASELAAQSGVTFVEPSQVELRLPHYAERLTSMQLRGSV